MIVLHIVRNYTYKAVRASANRVAAARGGWRPPTRRGGFFDFIYVIIDAIDTCMQNVIEIDRQKN